MKLYLVQHGEACAKDVDPQRPLTSRGRADVERVGAFLKQAGIRVARVIHSGKLRAVQTAESLAAALATGVEVESSGVIDPNDDPVAFDWQGDSRDRDTLVVGHLPFMAKLVSHLVINDAQRTFTAWQPGTVVCLERSDNGEWRIDWMIRPELFG
jgi:phosphohistidine phosphatase